MNIEDITGEWINSRHKSKGISKFIFRQEGDELKVEIYGSNELIGTEEWGVHSAICFSSPGSSNQFSAFHISTIINDTAVFMAGNINKGLIIIALYIQYGTLDNKSNYFIREFFYHNS